MFKSDVIVLQKGVAMPYMVCSASFLLSDLQNKPHPLAVMNNLCRRLPKKHFCQTILKSVQWFLTRRFLEFSKEIYMENKPHLLVAKFFEES